MNRVSLSIILGLITFVSCEAPRHVTKNEAYPNPFSPPSSFKYILNRRQLVLVTIHDTSGAMVDTAANGIQEAGEHVIIPLCSVCPSGMYFIHLKSEDTVYTKRFLLMK